MSSPQNVEYAQVGERGRPRLVPPVCTVRDAPTYAGLSVAIGAGLILAQACGTLVAAPYVGLRPLWMWERGVEPLLIILGGIFPGLPLLTTVVVWSNNTSGKSRGMRMGQTCAAWGGGGATLAAIYGVTYLLNTHTTFNFGFNVIMAATLVLVALFCVFFGVGTCVDHWRGDVTAAATIINADRAPEYDIATTAMV